MGWCKTPDKLMTADFNGDAKTDLICHDTTNNGAFWVSLSAGTGAYFQGGNSW